MTRPPPLEPADARFFAAARLRAARMQPYFASAVFSLIPIPTPGYGTFGVDHRWRVYVDMGRAREWGIVGTAAVLLHEAHHVVRDHHRRAACVGVNDELTRYLWNLAGDAAINDDLVADGVPLPSPILPHDLGVEPRGMEETYFRHLLTRRAPVLTECGSGAGGEPLPFELDDDVEGVDDADGDALRRGVAHDVTTAIANGADVSPRLARWAESLLDPVVPWRTLLRAALGRSLRGATGGRHETWRRPDRRADSHPDFLAPGTERHRPRVAVVVDTSASMDQQLLDLVVTEIDSLLHQTGVAPITVVACDSHAAIPQEVRRIGSIALSGGGGTDLRIGIDAAAKLRPRPHVIAVLTDGLTPWPPAAPAGANLVCVLFGRAASLPRGPGIVSIYVEPPR